VDEKWVGGVPEVSEYWTGSSDSSPVVTIRNNQVEQNLQPIWNIMGTIPGFDQLSEKVIFGSHRDAWCFGASDPNSGTAIMLEVARVFGEMMKFGWRPRRSIVFANWDAATYNLIGST
jgi:N-acetylated-alpha-linked acidic dipeptidase